MKELLKFCIEYPSKDFTLDAVPYSQIEWIYQFSKYAIDIDKNRDINGVIVDYYEDIDKRREKMLIKNTGLPTDLVKVIMEYETTLKQLLERYSFDEFLEGYIIYFTTEEYDTCIDDVYDGYNNSHPENQIGINDVITAFIKKAVKDGMSPTDVLNEYLSSTQAYARYMLQFPEEESINIINNVKWLLRKGADEEYLEDLIFTPLYIHDADYMDGIIAIQSLLIDYFGPRGYLKTIPLRDWTKIPLMNFLEDYLEDFLDKEIDEFYLSLLIMYKYHSNWIQTLGEYKEESKKNLRRSRRLRKNRRI